MSNIAALLLAWYDQSRRDLPWRYAPGVAADPYRVWLSEVMLQQTTVKAVVPFFQAFTTRWPTVADLAAAPLDEVLSVWAGLGYYSRARNLHAAAQAVARDHGGHFPRTEPGLRRLPGVGPYTAAAIAAIGHGLKATPVDGNIERVVARLFAITDALPAAKPVIHARAATLTPEARSGDFAQAMMDLGATVCTPKSPSCLICPLAGPCQARAQGLAATLPRKVAKPERPTRFGVAYVVRRADGRVLLRQRPAKGLLGGMHEVPSTDWSEVPPGGNALRAARPLEARFTAAGETVVHVFTHFRLELAVQVALVPASMVEVPPLFWAAIGDLERLALPSVMLKVLAAGGIASVDTTRKPPRRQR